MPIYWKERNTPATYTTRNALLGWINRTDYHTGQVETMQSKLENLTDLVVAMVDSLPEQAQRDLVKHLTNYVEADDE